LDPTHLKDLKTTESVLPLLKMLSLTPKIKTGFVHNGFYLHIKPRPNEEGYDAGLHKTFVKQSQN
jgi:hypothetical protein